MTTRWTWFVPSQIKVILALRTDTGAPPDPAGWQCAEHHRGTGLMATGGVTRTAQVTAHLDPHRHLRGPVKK